MKFVLYLKVCSCCLQYNHDVMLGSVVQLNAVQESWFSKQQSTFTTTGMFKVTDSKSISSAYILFSKLHFCPCIWFDFHRIFRLFLLLLFLH